MKRLTTGTALAAVLLLMPGQSARSFGGEDLAFGRPWHHLDITYRALAGDTLSSADIPATGQGQALYAGSGFTQGAAMSVAWHADYIDSYIYNPVWWAQTLGEGYWASTVGYEDLVRLHFDDNYTNAGLEDAWRRYAAGALAGLHWAAENNDVAAAQHILGLSLHAIQDFYSHSNWIDARRDATWHMTSEADRGRSALFTGAYELQTAAEHHGAISPTCSAIDQVKAPLRLVCVPFSPMVNSGACKALRECESANAPLPYRAAGAPVGLVLHPPGIAVDNTWVTLVQAPNRRLTRADGSFLPGKEGGVTDLATCEAVVNFGYQCSHDAGRDHCVRRNQPRRVCERDSDRLFATAKDLAVKSSMEWVGFLNRAMTRHPRHVEFWERVKTERTSLAARRRQFEDMTQLPYHFMSAGPYPVGNPDRRRRSITGYGSGATPETLPPLTSSDGWYLRLDMKTAGGFGAGTNADVKARVAGSGWTQTFLLDHLPTSDPTAPVQNALLVYNDFEAGERAVYTIGPFPDRPRSVTLINDSADAGEVLEAAWESAKAMLEDLGTRARRFIAMFAGGQADWVGDNSQRLQARELAASAGGVRKLRINGGAEGVYDLVYRITRLQPDRAGEYKFRFEFRSLDCIRESTNDAGWTTDDEPFFFASVTAFGAANSRPHHYAAGPFNGVDSGEERPLWGTPPGERGPQSFEFTVPERGFVALGAVVYESDQETGGDRAEMWASFKSGFDEDVRKAHGPGFLDAVGRAAAAAWTPERVRIFAFRRADIPEAGAVLDAPGGGELEGDEQRTYPLRWDDVRPLLLGNTPISSWSRGYRSPAVRPVRPGE